MVSDGASFLRQNRSVMACGHVSTGLYTTEEGEKIPVCLDDMRLKTDLAKKVVDISGRVANCFVCGRAKLSSPDLLSFYYTGKVGDTYYCGCQG